METSSIYERTGITGPFVISSIALVFPDTSHMDLTALAADIEANGLLEEITLAMTQRPGGTLTGVCMASYRGTSRVTSRLDLGCGQGSGSSQTRLQSLPRCSERLSQAMPCRITLTVRPGFSGLLR